MMDLNNTIIALSTGSVPSGIAIVRMSGRMVPEILLQMVGEIPTARKANLKNVKDPKTDLVLDNGLVIYFPNPNSFTGEDCAEFQIHGGRAVTSAVLDSLLTFETVRLAEPGEFSRRAFENGQLDLTEIEGLSDLIAADTEAQRKLALSQTQGDLRELYDGWRKKLIHLRAMIEAELDFSEEEDIPKDISELGFSELEIVSREIKDHLDDNSAGEIIKDGFKIALMGKPNSGKSSLLNALAMRDIAIVTEEAGTTRDVIEVNLNVNGYAVIFSDTAGIRNSENLIEQEGIRRAESVGRNADLVLWLRDISDGDTSNLIDYGDVLEIITKDDDGTALNQTSISSKTSYGLPSLLSLISSQIENKVSGYETGLVTRKRYRVALRDCENHIDRALTNTKDDIELRSENLRLACDCIGRITGKIDVEDLLDVIFSEFCVGK